MSNFVAWISAAQSGIGNALTPDCAKAYPGYEVCFGTVNIAELCSALTCSLSA